MTARVDQTVPAVGVVRGVLAATIASGDYDTIIGAGINSSGLVVKGAGQTGVVGIMIPSGIYNGAEVVAGKAIDIFRLGQVVDCVGLAAGTKYYITGAGAITTTATGNTYIGYTVEADRLILQVGSALGGAY